MKHLTVIASKSPPDFDKPLGRVKYVTVKVEDDALLQEVIERLSKEIISQLDLEYENRKQGTRK